MFWSGFIVGSAVGIIGITLYSCLVVASRADCDLEDEYEYEILICFLIHFKRVINA